MTYVALLRGINVGGNAKVDMASLKVVFEELGLQAVRTYINSGNVIFESKATDSKKLVVEIEQAIESKFGIPVKVIVRDLPAMQATARALPSSWTNDAVMKCDVMFLWNEVDSPKVMQQLPLINTDHEEVRYTPGAIFWRIDRAYASKSKISKLIGTDLYKKMTLRNCNTVRKLLQLMESSPN